MAWFLAQITIGQSYNPGHFRDVGIGVINGSLWSITTEILFYICVPVIVRMERRLKHSTFMLAFISFLVYWLGPFIWTTPVYRNKTVYDILALTPIVWGWMFALGIIAMKYYSSIMRVAKYFPLAVVPVAVMILFDRNNVLFRSSGNNVGLIYFISYSMIVFYLAFCVPAVKLKYDISYGIYIWHMPIINLMIALKADNAYHALPLTMAMAVISYVFIERPVLKFKQASLKRI